MFIRALAYILANGPDGLRQTTEDAVLNANYIRHELEDLYELPYKTASMHEVVFSDKRQAAKGVKTGDIAKRLIDYGFHPYTVSFPLIVHGALMIEPTESESLEELDLFIDAMRSIAKEVEENPGAGKDRAALHARLTGSTKCKPRESPSSAGSRRSQPLLRPRPRHPARWRTCRQRQINRVAVSNSVLNHDGQAFRRVPHNLGVAAHQRKALHRSLRDQHSVEWVLVDGRQVVDCGDVVRPERQHRCSQLLQCLLPPEARVAHVQLSLHALEHDLPVGDHAEHVRAGARCFERCTLRVPRGGSSAQSAVCVSSR